MSEVLPPPVPIGLAPKLKLSPSLPPALHIGPELVQNAYAAIHDRVSRTPVLLSPALSVIASTQRVSEDRGVKASSDMELFFKCENMQKTGSFKFRGAMYSVACLPDEKLKRGLVTTSSGNHGKAVASVARETAQTKGFPIPVSVVMPSNARASKMVATESYGADVFCSGNSWAERDTALRSIRDKTGATVISTSNNADIILGQGTLGVEFSDQVKTMGNSGLDAIVAPCGSGGMLSGLALAFQGSTTKVFGAEPKEGGADDASRGRAIDQRIETVESSSIADGLRCPVGILPWEIIRNSDFVAGIYSVSEMQIKSAMKLVFDEMRIVIEPSAAVPLAAVLFNEDFRSLAAPQGRPWRVGIVFSGGNVEVDSLKEAMLI